MKIINSFRFCLLSMAILGFILLSGKSFAQDKPEKRSKKQETITIHVTKEVDGKTMVIDTTVVNNADFDADAFLKDKGMTPEMENEHPCMHKKNIVRHHGDSNDEAERSITDTLVMDDGRTIIITKDMDMDMPDLPDMDNGKMMQFDFQMPDGQIGMDCEHLREMAEELSESFGGDNEMHFGSLKQITIKKKKHGNKIVITFGDNDESCCAHNDKSKSCEKEMNSKGGKHSSTSTKQKHVFIKGNTDKAVIIQDDDKATPKGKQKKMVIIKEDKDKK